MPKKNDATAKDVPIWKQIQNHAVRQDPNYDPYAAERKAMAAAKEKVLAIQRKLVAEGQTAITSAEQPEQRDPPAHACTEQTMRPATEHTHRDATEHTP